MRHPLRSRPPPWWLGMSHRGARTGYGFESGRVAFLREMYRTERRAALHQSFNVGEDDLADARALVQPLPKPVTQSTASVRRGVERSSAPLVTSEVVRTAPTRRNGAGAEACHRRRGHVVEREESCGSL